MRVTLEALVKRADAVYMDGDVATVTVHASDMTIATVKTMTRFPLKAPPIQGVDTRTFMSKNGRIHRLQFFILKEI